MQAAKLIHTFAGKPLRDTRSGGLEKRRKGLVHSKMKQLFIMEWAVVVALVAAIPLIVVGKVVGDRTGLVTASWYGEKYRGKPTASGELFDPDKLTAAHRRLPFGTRVRCRFGKRFVVVTITDRGPFVKGREIDLSRAAFQRLANTDAGLIRIRMEVLK